MRNILFVVNPLLLEFFLYFAFLVSGSSVLLLVVFFPLQTFKVYLHN